MNALIVRSPDLMSTHSACRGELFRRSRPKSLITSAAAASAAKKTTSARSPRFIRTEMLMLRGRCRGAPTADQRVDAPATRAIKQHVKEKPAIRHGELTLVGDWEKTIRRMNHKVSHSHRAAGDERCQPGEQTERDEKPADQANPAAQLQDRFI